MNQRSIRSGYEELGVKGFYAVHGSTYNNPHYAALCSSLATLLEKLFMLPSTPSLDATLSPFYTTTESLKLFDLACGSGEGSRALIQTLPRVISKIQRMSRPGASLPPISLEVCDPYTLDAFTAALDKNPLPTSITLVKTHTFTFEDMNDPIECYEQDTEANSEVNSHVNPFTLTTRFHLTIISFALHLANSTFHGVLTTLAKYSRLLIVLGPGKKVIVERRHGWMLLGYCCVERVHAWVYQSIYYE